MAKTKKGRFHRSGFKIPLAIVSGFVPAVAEVFREAKASGWERALKSQVPKSFMMYNPDPGANPRFGLAYANQGVGPILLGLIVHKVIGGMLGVNRALGNLRVPLIRL